MAIIEFKPDKRPAPLPGIRQIDSHSQIDGPHGPIFLVTGSQKGEWMEQLLKHVAPKACPKGKEDALDQGYLITAGTDSPVCIWRDIDGSGQECDDKIVLWVRPGHAVGEAERARMQDVQARVLGDEEDMDPSKARRLGDGTYEGGVAFERDARAISVGDKNRAYPLSTAHQNSRTLTAPQRGRKTMGRPVKGDHQKLVRDLLQVGGTAGMAGLDRGPKGLKQMLADRAEYLNIPRVGSDDNVAFPTMQLNIAAGVDADADAELTDSLGRYGSAHADCGDSASATTAMTCLTRPHPDAEPDIFFILDLGVGVIIGEFDTVYFCGTRFHGGSQPRYRSGDRTCTEMYIRLTLIAYAPAVTFDIPASEAFIAVPGKEGVYKVLREMKDWSTHSPFVRAPGSQATFTTDGESIMTPKAHFNHFVRNLIQSIMYAVDQYPLHRLLRVDSEKLLSCFTAVIDGVRQCPDPWPMGPGHPASEARPGKVYRENLEDMSRAQLLQYRNSDSLSPYPYGNKAVHNHVKAWKKHQEDVTRTIPLCVQGDINKETGEVVANPNARRTITRAIRNPPSSKQNKGKKKTPKIVQAGKVTAKSGRAPTKRLVLSHIEIPIARRRMQTPAVQTQDDRPSQNTSLDAPSSPPHNPTLGPHTNMLPHSAGSSTLDISHHSPSAAPPEPSSSTPLTPRSDPNTLSRPAEAAIPSSVEPSTLPTPSSPGPSTSAAPSRKRSRDDEEDGAPVEDGDASVDEDLEFIASDEPQPKPPKRRRKGVKGGAKSKASKAKDVEDQSGGTSNAALIPMAPAPRHDDTGKLIAALEAHELKMTVSRLMQLQECGRPQDVDQHQIAKELVKLFETNELEGVWSIKAALESKQQEQEFELAMIRGRTMQVEWVAWRWLDVVIDQAYASIKADGQHWLAKLGSRVLTLFTSGVSDVVDAMGYLPDVVGGDKKYRVKVMPLTRRMDNLDNFAFVMRPILLEWFDFPRTIHDLARGSLLAVLVARFGLGVLFVREVGEVYGRIARAIDPVNRKLTLSSCRKWAEALQETLDDRRYDNTAVLLQPLAAYAVDMTGIEGLLNSTGYGSIRDRRKEERVSNEGHSVFDMEAFNTFIDQIRRLYPILYDPLDPPPPPQRRADHATKQAYRFINHVFLNQDKKLPFRDIATSRRTILAPDGPFSPDNLYTRRGFFSAIVYRAITHHSRFLTEHHEILFDDLDDFKKRMAGYGKKEKYFFCDPAAYGSCTNLSVEHAELYWKASGDASINGWLLGGETIDFWTLVGTFVSSTDLPNVGPLIGYLLAADYAIAGAVNMPGIEEMGRIVHRIGMGSLKGLKKMGFVCDTEEETAQAFHLLYGKVCAHIPQETRDAMSFNVFVLEHMLCKFYKRLDIALYRDIFKQNSQ